MKAPASLRVPCLVPWLLVVCGSLSLDAAVPPGGTCSLHGRVYQANGSEALSGSLYYVTLHGAADLEDRQESQRPVRGLFFFTGLPPGRYQVSSVRDGHQTQVETVELAEGEDHGPILLIEGQTGVVEITVERPAPTVPHVYISYLDQNSTIRWWSAPAWSIREPALPAGDGGSRMAASTKRCPRR